MKATQYYKQSVEPTESNVFLELFKLQIHLNEVLEKDQRYGEELKKIVQAMDDLFDLMQRE